MFFCLICILAEIEANAGIARFNASLRYCSYLLALMKPCRS
ncbi:hypothetical protein BSIN_3670 [Burkholderia singularis]|uniref:Uncharacterized protein n=1 Tax=Burkholderia singularis TaxID=1503053 RepID=A0A238H5E9_9BURK|nr:hypothetical protein BSIN_3670 [Burkholderia singularis]